MTKKPTNRPTDQQTNRPKTDRPGHREVTLPITGSYAASCSSFFQSTAKLLSQYKCTYSPGRGGKILKSIEKKPHLFLEHIRYQPVLDWPTWFAARRWTCARPRACAGPAVCGSRGRNWDTAGDYTWTLDDICILTGRRRAFSISLIYFPNHNPT